MISIEPPSNIPWEEIIEHLNKYDNEFLKSWPSNPDAEKVIEEIADKFEKSHGPFFLKAQVLSSTSKIEINLKGFLKKQCKHLGEYEDNREYYRFTAKLDTQNSIKNFERDGEIDWIKEDDDDLRSSTYWYSWDSGSTADDLNNGISVEEKYYEHSRKVSLLKDFRNIYDNDNLDYSQALSQIQELLRNYKLRDYSEWNDFSRNISFTPGPGDKDLTSELKRVWGFKLMKTYKGIGVSKAYAIWDSGIRSVKELKEADDEELLNIKGINHEILNQFRSKAPSLDP